MTRQRIAIALAVLAAVALLGALGEWPYGYYRFLRLVICGAGAYTAFGVYERHRLRLAWLLGVVAMLFNPIVPMYLPRAVWETLEVACAVLFIFAALIVKTPPHSEGQPKTSTPDKQHLFGSAALAFLTILFLSGAVCDFVESRTNTTGGYVPVYAGSRDPEWVDDRWVDSAEYRRSKYRGALENTFFAAFMGWGTIALLKPQKEHPPYSPYSTL